MIKIIKTNFKLWILALFALPFVACAPTLEEEEKNKALAAALSASSWQLSPQSATALYQGSPPVVKDDFLTFLATSGSRGNGWIEKYILINQVTTKIIHFINFEISGAGYIKLLLKYVPDEALAPPATFTMQSNQLIINGGANLSSLLSAPIQYIYDKVTLRSAPQVTSFSLNSTWGLLRKETNSGSIAPSSPLMVKINFIQGTPGNAVYEYTLHKGANIAKYCNLQSYQLDTVAKKITLIQSNSTQCGETSTWVQSPQDAEYEFPFGVYSYTIQNNRLTLRLDGDPNNTTFVFELAYFEV